MITKQENEEKKDKCDGKCCGSWGICPNFLVYGKCKDIEKADREFRKWMNGEIK